MAVGDEKPRVFTDIEYRKGFETVGWFGFAGMAKKRVAFYVDNFTIRQLDDGNNLRRKLEKPTR